MREKKRKKKKKQRKTHTHKVDFLVIYKCKSLQGHVRGGDGVGWGNTIHFVSRWKKESIKVVF